jgi:hypothetical protein
MLPYVLPSIPQTGMYSLVHAIGFDSVGSVFESGFTDDFFTSLHNLSPQILLEVFVPKDFAPWDCGEPFAFRASAVSTMLNEVKNAADNNTLTVNRSDSVVLAMIVRRVD